MEKDFSVASVMNDVAKQLEKLEKKYNKEFVYDEFNDGNVILDNTNMKIQGELFDHIVKIYGYDNQPQVFSDEKYKKLTNIKSDDSNSLDLKTEFYRGCSKPETLCDLVLGNQFPRDNSDTANGIFVMVSKNSARYYTKGLTGKINDNLVLSLKIPDVKIVGDIELQKHINDIFYANKFDSKNDKIVEFAKYINSVSPELKAKFKYMFENDPGKFAILIGYDCVKLSDYPIYTLLNRSKICISQSEYDRIKDMSTCLSNQ